MESYFKNLRQLVAVDLDGTLIRTDLLHEAIVALAFTRPWSLMRAVIASRCDLARFKSAVAAERKVEAGSLPYREEVLEYLQRKKNGGAQLILATAAPEAWAEAVRDHLGIFDGMIGTTEEINLKGEAKLSRMRQLAGGNDFTYLGDSKADFPILRVVTRPVVVAPSRYLLRMLKQEKVVPEVLVARVGLASEIKAVLQSMRPHHWLKNLLIFLPAVTGWGTYPVSDLLSCGILFLSFCAAASGVYLANDLSDIEADRAHYRKRNRPIPSGRFAPASAVCLGAALLMFSVVASFLVSWRTGALVLGYLGLNALYSFGLKAFAVIDILFLASFYMIRVVAGAVTVAQVQSIWFTGFLSCGFLELAAMKRFIELQRSPDVKIRRRGYCQEDRPAVMNVGMLFGFAGALLLVLYTQSGQVAPIYARPAILAALAPLLISHNFWLWLRANRGQLHDDPVIVILQSKISWLVIGISLFLLLLAR